MLKTNKSNFCFNKKCFLPMVRETKVQSQVESYQKLKKWYLMLPCLTLSIIRYGSRVKWSNPGKGVAPFPTPRCSSYWKGSVWVNLDCSYQLYFFLLISFLSVFLLLNNDQYEFLFSQLFWLNEFSSICASCLGLVSLLSIFICCVFKKYQNWSCIYQDRNKHWMKH